MGPAEVNKPQPEKFLKKGDKAPMIPQSEFISRSEVYQKLPYALKRWLITVVKPLMGSNLIH